MYNDHEIVKIKIMNNRTGRIRSFLLGACIVGAIATYANAWTKPPSCLTVLDQLAIVLDPSYDIHPPQPKPIRN